MISPGHDLVASRWPTVYRHRWIFVTEGNNTVSNSVDRSLGQFDFVKRQKKSKIGHADDFTCGAKILGIFGQRCHFVNHVHQPIDVNIGTVNGTFIGEHA